MDTIEETITLAKQGLRRFDAAKDPSASYLPHDARGVVCYFPGDGGEEVTAWFNGQQVAIKPLNHRGAAGVGDVCFDVPDGATMLTTDPRRRRVVFL
jgi:hypothetical protein